MKTLQSFLSFSNKDSFGKSIIPPAVFTRLDILYRKKLNAIMAESKQQMKAVIHQAKKQVASYSKTKS